MREKLHKTRGKARFARLPLDWGEKMSKMSFEVAYVVKKFCSLQAQGALIVNGPWGVIVGRLYEV